VSKRNPDEAKRNPGGRHKERFRISQNSGVPEFCQYQLRKSETSDLRRSCGLRLLSGRRPFPKNAIKYRHDLSALDEALFYSCASF
jgi:hypothetical protein